MAGHPFALRSSAPTWTRPWRFFAEDVVFRSPAVFKPYEGREVVATILRTVFGVFEDFRYTDELDGDGVHGLLFEARVGDHSLQGIDLLRPDAHGQIAEFTVMIRPASGLIALAGAHGPGLAGGRRSRLRPAAARSAGWTHGVGDRDAARGADRVARADRPAVLDERDRGGGVVRDGLVEGPELLLGRCVAASAAPGVAPRPISAPTTAPAPSASPAVSRLVQAPDLAVGALVDDQQVDDADDVALAQALELGEHLAAEVGPVEGDDEELDGSHRGRLLSRPGPCASPSGTPPARAPRRRGAPSGP